MSHGVKIVTGDNINRPLRDDVVLDNTRFGGMPVHKTLLFKRGQGGVRKLMSTVHGLYAEIHTFNHDLGYIPAYIAFKGYGDYKDPSYMIQPFNNFVGLAGASDFVNVDNEKVIVGFDEVAGADFIKVLVFAAKLADE